MYQSSLRPTASLLHKLGEHMRQSTNSNPKVIVVVGSIEGIRPAVNHAPYAAQSGWVGTVNAALDEKTQAAAYAFLSYISQPKQSNLDVMFSKTEFNPYRISQLTNSQVWIEAGMNPQVARQYLNAIYSNLESQNIVVDLSIPQYEVYKQEILHPILIDFLNQEISVSEAMIKIESGWEKKTDELGRESQRKAYCQSLRVECN
jgi:multiple sugar transport system substrate-binding protein